MEITARLMLICPTESGISKATGEKWQAKDVVLEYMDNDIKNTIACHTMNKEIIENLEKCIEGDEVKISLGFQSKARTFTRRDDTEAIIRSTDVFIRKMEVTKEHTL